MNIKTHALVIISYSIFTILSHVNSLSFRVPRFDAAAADLLLLEGDAAVNPSSGELELNHMVNYTCRVGHVIYNAPVPLIGSDFSTHFVFTVDTRNRSLYGSGLAFFLAPAAFQIPPNSAGGFLGLFNTTTSGSAGSRIVSVEFDSFANPEWDPDYEHVGINVNSIASAVTANWSAAAHSGAPADVWIKYDSDKRNLSVEWGYGGGKNASLSYEVELREVLDRRAVVGITAASGIYSERHTIRSWEFNSTYTHVD